MVTNKVHGFIVVNVSRYDNKELIKYHRFNNLSYNTINSKCQVLCAERFPQAEVVKLL